MGQVATLRTLSNLVSRLGLANLAGKTFGGDRDLYVALGYKDVLEAQDYWDRYERNAIASRVIEAFPKGTWRGVGGELIEDEDPEKFTDFERAWWEMQTRLKIWPMLMRLDILAGLGRFAVLLIGAPGALNSPLPKKLNKQEILFLQPFSERDVTIKTLNEKVTDPRFGFPEIYGISRLQSGAVKNSKVESEVHWSRIIHVADGLLDDHVYGQPRLKKVWNLLDDLEKVTGAGSEAFWLRAHQGYQFDVDKETELDEEGEEDLKQEVDEFMHGLRRAVRTRGVKLQALGSDVANFDRNVESIISQISSGTGIPQRILMGSERGQLASEQDRVNWAERIQDRRMEYAGPMIARPLVDRLIEHGALPAPKEYDIRWPQIFDLSDDERAKIAVRWAEINQKNGRTVVTENEIRDRILLLGPLPEEVQRRNDEESAAENQPSPVSPPVDRFPRAIER